MRFVRFSYYKTANRTAPCGVVAVRYGAILLAVWCNITCDAVRLCNFAGDFGVVFTVCAVYAVW